VANAREELVAVERLEQIKGDIAKSQKQKRDSVKVR
jgi:hypothetical protein